MKEKVIVTKEAAEKCLCKAMPCATYVLQKLEGDSFCMKGPSSVQFEGLHNGCDCRGCLGKGGNLFCKVLVFEEPEPVKPEAVLDVDLTLDTTGAGSGPVKM